MPLVPGKNKNAVSSNIKTEMDAGKPQPQAVAIALKTANPMKKPMTPQQRGAMFLKKHYPTK